MPSLIMVRKMSKRSGDDKIKLQAEYIVERGLGGSRGKTWKTHIEHFQPIFDNNLWVFKIKIDFEKISGRTGTEIEFNQFDQIKSMIQQAGCVQRFQNSPWTIVEQEEQTELEKPESLESLISEVSSTISSYITVKEVHGLGEVKEWSDLIIPDELLGNDSDKHIAQHPAWKDLYGVNPQIRIILSNIKRAQETNGESRNHTVLYGHSGAGKTTSMFALEKMFGKGSVLKLDATSTTKAGLEKLFFSEPPAGLKKIPPLVIMEEAEKADPDALKIWLGALDDRGEIRKINFRVNQLRKIKVLFICSVNNKSLFDRMMGSDGVELGALSSRCSTQIFFPRPSDNILYQILEKEIREKGGKKEWIAPAIQIAKKLKITDPRIVKSYLSGGDRLLDSTYEKDWLAIYELQKSFNKEKQ